MLKGSGNNITMVVGREVEVEREPEEEENEEEEKEEPKVLSILIFMILLINFHGKQQSSCQLSLPPFTWKGFNLY